MATMTGSMWSFAATELRELQIHLRNGRLRVQRGDSPEVIVTVADDQDIAQVLQAELNDGTLTLTQRGVPLRAHVESPRGNLDFDFGLDGFMDGMMDVVDGVMEAVEGIGGLTRGQPGERERNRPAWSGHHGVDVTVSLPAALELSTLSARLDRGDVEALNVYGVITLHTGLGNLTLTGCGRTVSAKTGRGAVLVTGCSGDLDLHTGMGDVRLVECDGKASAHSGKGTVRLERCRLEGSCHTGQGDLWLEGLVGSGVFRTGAGTMTVVRPDAADLDIQSGMGDVLVQGGHAHRLRAHGGAGTVRCHDLRVTGELDLHTGMGNVVARGGSAGRLRIKSGAGNVECATALGAGDHELETGAGNIEVRLADNARVRLDAVSRMGSVHSDFDLVKVGRPGPVTLGGGRFVGSIGAGEAVAALHIKTGAGNIAIRRSHETWSAEQPAPVANQTANQEEPSSAPASAERMRLAILHSLQRHEISVEEAMILLEKSATP